MSIKTKTYAAAGSLLLAMAITSLVACKHDNNTANLQSADDGNSGYALDYTKMERNSNDVISIADAAAATGGDNLRTTETTIGGCAVVHNNMSVTPHVLTIAFPSADCVGLDNRNRRGSIIVYYTGNYTDSNSIHTITYDNYYIDDNQLTGSKTVKNNGTNASGQVYYTVSVNDTLNLGPGNGNIIWTGTRTRTWVDGYSTADRLDDVYSVSGASTLTRASGTTYTLTTTSPLKIAQNCRWIEQGTLSVSGTGSMRTLDYGTGDCDAAAQLTIGTSVYNITLNY